jgi:hypothetical protein
MLTERTAGAWVLLKQMQGHPRRSADNHPGSDHVDEITVDWLLMSPKRQRSTPRAVPTAGRLAATIAAVRGIAPEDVDRKTDPLWRYLGAFSTVYIDAARVRFLAGHHTRGLCIEEALAEIMANLEEESFGTAL